MKPLMGVAVVCLLAARAAAVDLPQGFSQPANGLAARLASDRAEYEEGQYIWITLDILNTTGKDMQVAWGDPLESRLRIVGPDDKVVTPRPPRGDPGPAYARPLAAGCMDERLFYVNGNQYARYPTLPPGRYCVEWSGPAESPVAGALAPQGRHDLTFTVVAAKPVAYPPNSAAAEAPWGKVADGLQTRVRAERARYYAGQPIQVWVEVRNSLSGEDRPYFVPQTFANGRLVVRDADGRSVPYVGGSMQTSNPSLELKPGAVATLAQDDLAAFYYLYRPGRYTVSFAGYTVSRDYYTTVPDGEVRHVPGGTIVLPPSNTLSVEVLPAPRPDRRLAAAGVLLDHAPKRWQMDVDAGRLSGRQAIGHTWSRVPHATYTFCHEEMFAGGRLDMLVVPPLTVCVADERAVPVRWQRDDDTPDEGMACLGESPYGFVYATATPDAASLKRWPTFRADIVKWLKVEAN